MEFFRCSPKMPIGSGMRGCDMDVNLRTLSQGSATRSPNRHILIDDAIDEARIGAVFEQASHQVRQQIFVTADRRIDAARHASLFAPITSAYRSPPMPCRRWNS